MSPYIMLLSYCQKNNMTSVHLNRDGAMQAYTIPFLRMNDIE